MAYIICFLSFADCPWPSDSPLRTLPGHHAQMWSSTSVVSSGWMDRADKAWKAGTATPNLDSGCGNGGRHALQVHYKSV